MMRNLLCLPSFLFALLVLSGCQSRSTGHSVLMFSSDADGGAMRLPAEVVSERTRGAAAVVLASLDDSQRQAAVRAIDDPLREDWHFVPRQREGLRFGDMNPGQLRLVHALIQTALSDAGYLHATQIIWLESLLREMENNDRRDPGDYALLIFGDPSDASAPWGWRLEGHHLSVNLMYTGEAIEVTPLFFGTNPAVVPQGPLAGLRVLSDVHSMAVAFAGSLDAGQREAMMLGEKPRDVITGPGNESALGEPVGVSNDDLTPRQQADLLELVLAHIENLDTEHAAALYIRSVNLFGDAPILHGYRVSWAGPIDADGAFYYRIQGDRLVIEYSCQGRNHVHCVIHDLSDPLGREMLRRHYEQHEHGDPDANADASE